MTVWLTVSEAAHRVGKSEATIYRWIRHGYIVQYASRISEDQLLQAESQMQHVGRPKNLPLEVRLNGHLLGTATIDVMDPTLRVALTVSGIYLEVRRNI
jgi:excisionase family DNA binding protein